MADADEDWILVRPLSLFVPLTKAFFLPRSVRAYSIYLGDVTMQQPMPGVLRFLETAPARLVRTGA